MEQVFTFTHPVEVCKKMQGIITTPTGYDPEKETLPVIVFLHGAGERGSNIEDVKVHGIPKYFTKDPDYKGLRAITLSPQCPKGMVWNQLPYPLMTWIRAAMAHVGAKEDHVAITGISMGGFGTWEMLMTFPKFFCCGAPICGGGMSWRTDALKGKRIRAFHGLDDTVVPFSYSQQMVNAARAYGADVTLTAFDHVDHDSWTPTYETTDIIEWLVRH